MAEQAIKIAPAAMKNGEARRCRAGWQETKNFCTKIALKALQRFQGEKSMEKFNQVY